MLKLHFYFWSVLQIDETKTLSIQTIVDLIFAFSNVEKFDFF